MKSLGPPPPSFLSVSLTFLFLRPSSLLSSYLSFSWFFPCQSVLSHMLTIWPFWLLLFNSSITYISLCHLSNQPLLFLASVPQKWSSLSKYVSFFYLARHLELPTDLCLFVCYRIWSSKSSLLMRNRRRLYVFPISGQHSLPNASQCGAHWNLRLAK